MPARAAVYELLTTDPTLLGLGVSPATVYASPTVDSPQAAPFVIIKWLETSPRLGGFSDELLQVWVYDFNKDYGRIDSIIEQMMVLMADAVHVVGEDGGVLHSTSFSGISQDLYDDIYGAVMRNVSWRVSAT